MEISLSSNSITDDHIATKFGTCHDSPAVVPCAKYCSDHFISIWMGAKWNFHHIWIVMERLLVKWAPAGTHQGCHTGGVESQGWYVRLEAAAPGEIVDHVGGQVPAGPCGDPSPHPWFWARHVRWGLPRPDEVQWDVPQWLGQWLDSGPVGVLLSWDLTTDDSDGMAYLSPRCLGTEKTSLRIARPAWGRLRLLCLVITCYNIHCSLDNSLLFW